MGAQLEYKVNVIRHHDSGPQLVVAVLLAFQGRSGNDICDRSLHRPARTGCRRIERTRLSPRVPKVETLYRKMIDIQVVLMTGSDFRRIALTMPDASEGSHFGNADFRIGGRIFATLSLESQGYGVLLLTPEQQAGMVEDAPEIFSPVPGGWGLKGSTRVHLGSVTPDVLESALHTAWQLRLASNSKSKPRKKQRTSPER